MKLIHTLGSLRYYLVIIVLHLLISFPIVVVGQVTTFPHNSTVITLQKSFIAIKEFLKTLNK